LKSKPDWANHPARVKVWNEMKKLFAAACLALVIPAYAGASSAPHVYGNSFRAALKIGSDLYTTLDPKFQKCINPEAIRMESMDAPVITPIPGNDENKLLSQVFVSDGFIDLMNHLAHAKAIDRIQKGYFEQYVLNLARDTATDAPVNPPSMVEDRFWTDDVMNEQISVFNQMMGMTIAMNLAHHYKGNFNKYANQMLAGKLVPINNLLAPAEWEAAVKAATLNSLDCALGTDGVKSLFEAIDKMPKRPGWTLYIVPATADLKKLNKTLTKYENDYFHGGLK